MEKSTYKVKAGLAEMLKGGVIMDVTNAEQARIAEEAGAVSVMALDKIPADVRASGGVARTAKVEIIEDIMKAVSIPVMAKCRIGHYGEARLLEEMKIDYIDESEVLTPADHIYHLNKWDFKVPVLNGCRNLGEALRRIEEGAAMLRTKGEPGTGDISQAVDHMRIMRSEIAYLVGLNFVKENKEYVGKRKSHFYEETKFETLVKLVGMKELDKYYKENGMIGMDDEIRGLFKKARTLRMDYFDDICKMDSRDFLELYSNKVYNIEGELPKIKEEYGVSQEIIDDVGKNKRLPVVNFAAGGVATPADAAFMMMLGADGVFVGSGIFKSKEPPKLAKAIVEAVTFWKDPEIIKKVSYNLGEAMKGISSDSLKETERMQDRST